MAVGAVPVMWTRTHNEPTEDIRIPRTRSSDPTLVATPFRTRDTDSQTAPSCVTLDTTRYSLPRPSFRSTAATASPEPFGRWRTLSRNRTSTDRSLARERPIACVSPGLLRVNDRALAVSDTPTVDAPAKGVAEPMAWPPATAMSVMRA